MLSRLQNEYPTSEKWKAGKAGRVCVRDEAVDLEEEGETGCQVGTGRIAYFGAWSLGLACIYGGILGVHNTLEALLIEGGMAICRLASQQLQCIFSADFLPSLE